MKDKVMTNSISNQEKDSPKARQKVKLNKLKYVKIKDSAKDKNAQSKVSQNKLKLLFTIVSRNKAEFYVDLIQSFDVNMQINVLANGMAPQSILELIGLNSEKVVILSVIQESKIEDALTQIEEKFNTIKDGKGIAFTTPLTSVIGTLIYGFLSNNKMAVKEDKTK